MAKIPVLQDNQAYSRLLKSNGPNRYKEIKDVELKTLPAAAHILTGMKPGFGGGPSPDGFVMSGTMLWGRIRIEGRVKDGAITV